ncbi:MAG: hypothetical protein CMJ83_10495 [Planctomycetes bacterium]|nr:hypothetical protein [Planctomycetota bacterium]
MSRLILIVSMVLSSVSALDAQPPEQAELQTLLDRLTSEDFGARERASDRFVALGAPARDFLTKMRKTLGLEARLRVDAILARLGTETTRKTGKVTATLVSIELVEVPLAEAAARIGATVGAKIRYGNQPRVVKPGGQQPAQKPQPPPGGAVPISFKVQRVPFFEALDRFCKLANCTYHTDYASGDIILNPSGQKGAGPVVYAGPLRIAATSLSVTRQTRFVGASTSNANLQVRIDIEPGAPIIGFLSPISGAQAKDDKGNVISFRAWQGQRYLQNVSRNRQLYQSLAMDPPAVDAKKLVEISIPIEMVTPAEMIGAELTSLQPAAPDAPGESPLHLRVDSLTTQNDHQILTLSFEAPPAQGPGDLRAVPQHEEIEIWDVKGQRVEVLPNPSQRVINGRCIRTLRLPDVPLGRVRVRSMVRFRILRQIVRFKDLPLP